MSGWDVPDFKLEPPDEPVSMAWCDCCHEWHDEHCEDGWGWCASTCDFTQPDYCEECCGFVGDAPDRDGSFGDDPRIDMLREEGLDYD